MRFGPPTAPLAAAPRSVPDRGQGQLPPVHEPEQPKAIPANTKPSPKANFEHLQTLPPKCYPALGTAYSRQTITERIRSH